MTGKDTELDEIFANHISNKGCILEYIKRSPKLKQQENKQPNLKLSKFPDQILHPQKI